MGYNIHLIIKTKLIVYVRLSIFITIDRTVNINS